jgi:transposase
VITSVERRRRWSRAEKERIVAAASPPIATPRGLIEIELATGTPLRISGAVDAATVSAVIAALTGRRR